MSCKLGDKCDNVFACNILRPNVELLGCNFYKPKKPMTNEQWLKQANTEQLADCISDITCNCWGCKRIYVEDCPNYARYKACFCDKEDVLDWLKQQHANE